MLRQILVPLDTKGFTAYATRVAAQIANEVKAAVGREAVTLLGLAVVDHDQLPTGRFASLVPRDEILNEARDKAKALMGEFEALAAKEGVAPQLVQTRFTEGSPFQAIMHHHVFADMVVMGPNCCFPPVSVDYDTLDQLYHRASRPILLVHHQPRPVKRVLMVLDGTASSSRMMYAYAHLNPFPSAKVVIAHSRYEEDFHNLKDFFLRVDEYLKSFRFETEQLTAEGHLIESIPILAKSNQADAIAIGVHAEHFLDKLRNPLNLAQPAVKVLLSQTDAMLFTVH